MKTCLVTIVIGDKFNALYNEFSRARFEASCRKWGYDLKVITEPVRDLPGKKLTWQKQCLQDLPWFNQYDKICFMDSDILIAKDAPELPDVPPGKIGCVLDKGPFQVNSGVLIFQPGPEVVAVFEESLKDTDPFWDQKSLTRVLQETGRIHLIDRHFHRMFYLRCWTAFGSIFGRHWVYHALHGKKKLKLIQRLLWLQGR